MKHTVLTLTLMAFLVSTASAATLTYTTGLDVWLDASDIDGTNNSTLTEGASFDTWVNKGTTGAGNATRATGLSAGSTASTYLATGGNGGQAAATLSNTLYYIAEPVDSASTTMYFVVNRAASSSANSTLLNNYGAGNSVILARAESAGLYLRDEASNSFSTVAAVATVDTWATITQGFDSATGNATWGELGNTATDSLAAYDNNTIFNGDPGDRPFALFGFWDGNNTHDFNGMVSEVLIYDHVLDAAAQTQVESYLVAKTVPEPATMSLLALGGIAMLRRKKK